MTIQDTARSAPPDQDRVSMIVLRCLLGFSGAIMLLSLVPEFRGRWSVWKQGDWLINSISGPVRRGPSGTVLIELSDVLGVSPVSTVIGLQVVLAALLYGAYYLAVRGLDSQRVALLLTCSPVMFVIFWPANVFQGAFRKEMIAMAALALMLLYLRERQVWSLLLAGALMTAGVWAHEIVILFGPAFLYLAWRAAAKGRVKLIATVALVAAVSGVLAGLYAVVYSSVPDVLAVCEPLTARGLDARICSGPFRWLGIGSEESMSIVRRRNATTSALALFAVAVALSAAPLAYLTALLAKRRVVLIGVLLALPVLPLFVVVIDWGRWLSCGVFIVIAVVIAHALTEGLPLRREPALPVVLGLVALGCLVAPYHVSGLVTGGIFSNVVDVLQSLRQSL